MKPEEVCEKLWPIIGERADKLHQLYLLEDYKNKAGVEAAINLLRVQHLNEHEILLPPPQDTSGDYPIGEVIYNGKKTKTFYLKKKDLTRHLAIFGTTGSGKTNACFYLLANLFKDDIPFLITDFKQNYRDLIETEIGKNIKVYTVGKEIAPFHFNPLIPPKGADPKTYINKLIDVINHSHFVSYGVDYLLQTAIDQVYKECGFYAEEINKVPTFTDVLEHLKKRPASGRESLWKASAMRTLQDLTFGPVGEVFNTEKSIDIPEFLTQQVILELDALPQTTKTFLVEALLLQIYLYRINERNRDEKLKHMLILEEAHHLLLKHKEQAETITDIFLREIRETGQGICMLDQSPALISNTALSNINTLIAMQLRHKDDINQIAKALLLKLKDQEYFGMLKVGEAIVKTESPKPFLIKFPLSPIKKGKVDNDKVRLHMKDDLKASFSADSKPKTPPPDPITQNKEIRKTDKLTEEETEFLKDIAKHPLSGVSSRYKRLNLSVEKGNETKNSLIEKDILKPIVIPTNSGRILLLEPTSQGKEIFKGLDLKILAGRQGGLVHEYWRMKVAYYYKDKGFKVRQEVPVSNGKTVDLVIEKDNQKTAIEIETGKSKPTENIRKCLDSNFHQIICVATNPEIEKKIKAELLKDGLDGNKTKIAGCKGFC